ncbi:hypothetical protein C8Q78DRAFT_606490 [Trametes maxima]|nr:hypothetical protein C8Q78DRAFT_606490 [Trametes maxima]
MLVSIRALRSLFPCPLPGSSCILLLAFITIVALYIGNPCSKHGLRVMYNNITPCGPRPAILTRRILAARQFSTDSTRACDLHIMLITEME